jgi:hypothetical protein
MTSSAPGAQPKTVELWLRLGGSDGSAPERRSPTPEKLALLNKVRLLSLAIFALCVTRLTLNATWAEFSDVSLSLAVALGAAMCGVVGSLRMHQDSLVLFYLLCALGIVCYGVDLALGLVKLPKVDAAVIEISSNVTGLLPAGKTPAEVFADGQVVKRAIIVSIVSNTALLLVELAGLIIGYQLVRDHFPHPAWPSQVAVHDGSRAADASKLEQGSASSKGTGSNNSRV